MDAFPNHLDLKQQGLFMLGYYHQTAYRAPSKSGEVSEQTIEHAREATIETEVTK